MQPHVLALLKVCAYKVLRNSRLELFLLFSLLWLLKHSEFCSEVLKPPDAYVLPEYADACDAFAQACTTQWLIASKENKGYDVFHPDSWIEFSRATVQRCDSHARSSTLLCKNVSHALLSLSVARK
jgi:hypothetical protein